MGDVRKQQQKCKDLRNRLVTWVGQHHGGHWMMGCQVARAVYQELQNEGIHTTEETLMKELRAAVRKGELVKSYNGQRNVMYRPVGTDSGVYPHPKSGPPGGSIQGSLLGDADEGKGHWQRD